MSGDIELDICNFYIKVVREMHDLYHPNFEDFRKSLSAIRSYKNPEIEIHETVNFDEKNDRFAYVFAYCFLHSVVIYDRFSDMLKCNPTMSQKITSMRKLRLCILGGGAGFEVVSVCEILKSLRKQSDKSPPLLLDVTIIDECEDWKNDADLLISLAQNIYSESNIKIHYSFIPADLTTDFSEDVKKTLKKSHIVMMCKILSEVNDSSYSKSEIDVMMQNIIEYMNFRSCLFLLDYAGGGFFKRIFKMIDALSETFMIYDTNHNCHMLSIDSVEMISQSLKHIFHNLKCTVQTTISCSAWLITRNTVNMNELSSGICFRPVGSSADPEPRKLKAKGWKAKVKKTCQPHHSSQQKKKRK